MIFISPLKLNYTSEMEKAMHGAHGVGYAVYCQKHEVRMQVEQKRQMEYAQSQTMLANLERRFHS